MNVMITGHRPHKLPTGTVPYVKLALVDALSDLPDDAELLVGMARGVDMWAVRVAVRLGIPFHAFIPFDGFDSRWPDADRAALRWALSHAASVSVVSSRPSKDAFLSRNGRMAELAHMAVAVWDGRYRSGTAASVRRLEQRDVPITVIPV